VPDVKVKEGEEAIVDIATLEKSWNDAISNLKDLVDGDGETLNKSGDHLTKKTPDPRLSKGKVKKAKKGEEGYEEEEGAEEEEEELGKSLEEEIGDLDEEAEIAMDVEPFLKSFVDAVDNRLKSVEATVTSVKQLQKAQSEVLLTSAEMQKNVGVAVEKMGNAPLPTMSVMRKAVQKFGQGDKEIQMNTTQILTKSHELVKSGKLDVLMATKIEGRLNKGVELSDEMKSYFVGEK